MHILVATVLLLLNIKHNTLPKAFKYWKSIIYVSTINFIYYFICNPYLLWDFNSKIFNRNFVRFLHIAVINPLIILLFLSRLPKKVGDQFSYFIKSLLISLSVEFVAKKFFRAIYFSRGWNIGYSACIYAGMYFYSYLMIKRPRLTWFLSGVTINILLYIFQVPIKNNVIHNINIGKKLIKSNELYLQLATIASSIMIIFTMLNLLRIKWFRKRLFHVILKLLFGIQNHTRTNL